MNVVQRALAKIDTFLTEVKHSTGLSNKTYKRRLKASVKSKAKGETKEQYQSRYNRKNAASEAVSRIDGFLGRKPVDEISNGARILGLQLAKRKGMVKMDQDVDAVGTLDKVLPPKLGKTNEAKAKRPAPKKPVRRDTDNDDNEEPPTCPACGGDGTPMGTLGNRQHSRCRACGMDFSRVREAISRIDKFLGEGHGKSNGKRDLPITPSKGSWADTVGKDRNWRPSKHVTHEEGDKLILRQRLVKAGHDRTKVNKMTLPDLVKTCNALKDGVTYHESVEENSDSWRRSTVKYKGYFIAVYPDRTAFFVTVHPRDPKDFADKAIFHQEQVKTYEQGIRIAKKAIDGGKLPPPKDPYDESVEENSGNTVPLLGKVVTLQGGTRRYLAHSAQEFPDGTIQYGLSALSGGPAGSGPSGVNPSLLALSGDQSVEFSGAKGPWLRQRAARSLSLAQQSSRSNRSGSVKFHAGSSLGEASNGSRILGLQLAKAKGGQMYQLPPAVADAVGRLDMVLIAHSVTEKITDDKGIPVGSLAEAVFLSGRELRRLDRARRRRKRRSFKVKASTRSKIRRAARKSKSRRKASQRKKSTQRKRRRSTKRYSRIRGSRRR